MIKMWGIIMIIVSAATIGWQLSLNLKKRILVLETIKFIFEEISNEACFAKEVLPEILNRVIDKVDGTCKEWLHFLIERLADVGEISFAGAWKESLEVLGDLLLPTEDTEIFENFGVQITNLNEERLKRVVSVYVKTLENRIDLLKKDYIIKSKLYKSLGVLSGIFIIIIVI